MNTLNRINEIKAEIEDIKEFLSDYSLEIVEEYELSSLTNSSRLEEVIQEVAYSNTDVYTSDLHKWLGSCPKAYECLFRARTEFGTKEGDEEIRFAQYLWILDAIYNEVDKIEQIIILTEELAELEREQVA